MNYRNWMGIVLAASIIGFPTAYAQDEPVLGFASLTNPKLTVGYDQPPTVGIQFQELTFADAANDCAQQLVDGVTQRLLAQGIDVSDRQDLRNILVERQLQDVGLKGIQVATALVAVNTSRCTFDYDLARDNRKYLASTSYYIQGSIRLIDVSTGKVMLTQPIRVSIKETSDSYNGYPEYPPLADVEMKAVEDAVEKVSAVLTTTRPTVELLFFDDKSCGLRDAYRLAVSGDNEGALHFLQERLRSCRVTSAKKTKLLARVHHNLGVLQMMLGDHESAYKSLQSAVQLRSGPYIQQAFEFSRKAKASAAKAKQVELRTREMNAKLMEEARVAPPAQPRQKTLSATPAPRPALQQAPPTSTDKLAERLRRLESLFKQGLINEADYDAKKAEILSEL